MAALILIVFWDVLTSGGGRIVSAAGTDLQAQFIPWRDFAMREMRAGRVPLWDPHAFCGTPFVGNLQSALFYPPHLAMLAMSSAAWANWTIALHVWLAGALTYGWARYRAISRGGATIAGASYMFCAPYALHILAGHVSFICTAAWAPLLFWCADGLLNDGKLKWAWIGSWAVAMQLLAGYPQPAYIAAMAASIYLALNLVRHGARRRIAGAWIGMYVAAVLLAGIQIGPAVAANRESSRAGTIAFELSSAGSMPIRNLLTLAVPGFWGDEVRFRYFSSEFNWEDVPYLGAIPLALALAAGKRKRRFAWSVAIAMAVIALGSHTPLYAVLYRILPIFGRFRVPGRYFVGAAPLIAIMAGLGFDHMREDSRIAKRMAIGCAVAALALIGGAAWLMAIAPNGLQGPWGKVLGDVVWPPGTVTQISSAFFHDEEFAQESARFAGQQCFVAAAFIGSLAAFIIASRWRAKSLDLMVALALLEMTAFMIATHATCAAHPAIPPAWTGAIAELGDARAWCPGIGYSNGGMTYGFDNITGYDPLGIRRFEELSERARTPGAEYPPLPLLRLLRCRFVLEAARQPPVAEVRDPMRPVELVGRYTLATRDQALTRVCEATFDPTSEVILETAPDPLPQEGGGTARVLSRTTDRIEIEASANHPTLLLITDAYSADWRARALAGSAQQRYDVLPADGALRAIPLSAGHHHLVLEYRPAGWLAGVWATAISSIGMLAVGAILLKRRRANLA